MRNRSVKRAKQEREYKIIRNKFLELNPVCQVNYCLCEATDIHHKKGRIGELLTNADYFLAVCRSHHNYIENHPTEAMEAGYSLSRLAKEEVSELKKV